jgi:hypothetical protein
VAAGAFDDAGGDGPAGGQGAGVVQVGGLGGQVGQGPGDDLVVLAAGPGRVRGSKGPDPADDLGDLAVQDVQALGGDPVLGGRVAGGVEAPGGLPQVFQLSTVLAREGDVSAVQIVVAIDVTLARR